MIYAIIAGVWNRYQGEFSAVNFRDVATLYGSTVLVHDNNASSGQRVSSSLIKMVVRETSTVRRPLLFTFCVLFSLIVSNHALGPKTLSAYKSRDLHPRQPLIIDRDLSDSDDADFFVRDRRDAPDPTSRTTPSPQNSTGKIKTKVQTQSDCSKQRKWK